MDVLFTTQFNIILLKVLRLQNILIINGFMKRTKLLRVSFGMVVIINDSFTFR
jgi:hypothetical protein